MSKQGGKKVQVFVRLKPGVLDVQGKAVEGVAREHGFESVSKIRVGRLIEFEVSESENAQQVGEKFAAQMLGNPVIENTEVKVLG